MKQIFQIYILWYNNKHKKGSLPLLCKIANTVPKNFLSKFNLVIKNKYENFKDIFNIIWIK